jgi:flagellar motor switch/type III secretory pathway protein FliN
VHSLAAQMSNQGVGVTNTIQNLSASDEARPALRRSLLEQFPWLPLNLTLEIPVPGFTVEELLALAPGAIFKTLHPSTADVPIRANEKLIAWAKFEVSGEKLAARVTELA